MCTEINISPELKQSINIESRLSARDEDSAYDKVKFRLAYTKPLMEGKKWKEIRIFKEDD
jgi:hypothetical protein